MNEEELTAILLKRYIGAHERYSLFLSDLNELEISGQTAKRKKYSNTKFHENSFSELFHADRQTDGHDEAILRTCLQTID
jgi:hypothetical protein